MHPVPTGMMRSPSQMFYNDREGGHHRVEAAGCPSCAGVFLLHSDTEILQGPVEGEATMRETNEQVILPRASSRPPVSGEVPEPYRGLYNEAALILQDSPRASAALSRRCLQHLLREKVHAPPSNLYHEIEWALANAGLPGHVTDSLHDLREIGNMAGHPNKSTATGEYMEVEPGEAEWTLDTLDALFAHYFIEPARTAARKAALAAKTGQLPEA
jgi:hypothetical protein